LLNTLQIRQLKKVQRCWAFFNLWVKRDSKRTRRHPVGGERAWCERKAREGGQAEREREAIASAWPNLTLSANFRHWWYRRSPQIQ